MRIRDALSRENLTSFAKGFRKLRIRTDHSSIITFSALILILFTAFGIRLFPMRWEIVTGSMHLSEFDPYFQFRFTEYILKNGFISWAYPTQWVDTQRWYPDGINVARAGFPGLPFTAASLYTIVSTLGINVELMDFCAIFPPIFGMLACLAIFFLGKDFGGRSVGLCAALFLALSPSFIQRSSVGFFDDETIGVLALLVFTLFFMRSIEDDRPLGSTVKYALASGLALGYFFSGWGAAYYAVGVTVLYVFVLILLRRYTQRVLLSYSLTYGLGLFIAINVPKLTTAYLTQFTILPVAGVFVLLCLGEVFRVVTSFRGRIISVIVFLAILIGGFSVMWQLGFMQGIAGKFISVINPLARGGSPLVESVAEHRISAWGSIYYDLGVGIIFFAVSLFFLLRNPTNRNVFLLVFGLTSLYFACSMVRLLVLMAPAFSVLAGVGITGVVRPFGTLLKEPPKITAKKKLGLEYVGKEFSGAAVFMIFLVLVTSLAFPMPKVYRQAFVPTTVSAGSLGVAPGEPVREWLDMLKYVNDFDDSTVVVCSWWDYGYWLTVLGNITSLADNATINGTQIQNVGFIFMGNETHSLKMLERYNAEYILVFTTFDIKANWLDWAGGDNGKWMWMARISGQARTRFVNDSLIEDDLAWDDETTFGEYNSSRQRWVWNRRGMDSTVYKLMAWGKYMWSGTHGIGDPETQEWANYNLVPADIVPKYFKPAFFSGLALSPGEAGKYGNIIPLVCLYEIDWELYYSDNPVG